MTRDARYHEMRRGILPCRLEVDTSDVRAGHTTRVVRAARNEEIDSARRRLFGHQRNLEKLGVVPGCDGGPLLWIRWSGRRGVNERAELSEIACHSARCGSTPFNRGAALRTGVGLTKGESIEHAG